MHATIVIVPTARAAQVDHVRRLWAAQTTTCALLFAPSPTLALTSVMTCAPTSTIGEARNAGMAWAAARGFDVAVFWDDDNYYGPQYVEDIACAFEEAPAMDVVYKPLAFVRHDDGLWWYDEARTHFFPGHSSAVRIERAVAYPAASYAEDVAWTRSMQAAGRRGRKLAGWGLVYDRRSPAEHAYNAPREIFLRQHGPARYLGNGPDSIVDVPFASAAEWKYASDEDVFSMMRRSTQ